MRGWSTYSPEVPSHHPGPGSSLPLQCDYNAQAGASPRDPWSGIELPPYPTPGPGEYGFPSGGLFKNFLVEILGTNG